MVNTGAGILPSGSGNVGESGIYANGRVGVVHSDGGDIRGDIVSNDEIIRVGVRDGSIINADILQTSFFEDAREFSGGFRSTETRDTLNNPEYEIGSVSVEGNGGIIGTLIGGSDVGPIRERGGFGIFNSRIVVIGADNRLASVKATGYGIRNVEIQLGASLGDLVAEGDGTSLSTNAISNRVRLSEVAESDPQLGPVDPMFGFESNPLTDIHATLGTSSVQGEISGVTDTGVIEGVTAAGQRDLRNVQAWQIRGQSRLDFGNSVGTLAVRDMINGLELTTGTLKTFSLAQDAFALTVSVSGRVKKVDIKGSLAGNSVIRTVGNNGQFDNVNVAGNLIGNINSSRSIKSINIGGDFTGNVSVNSGGTAIKTLKVGGAFLGGSLDVVGNVGTIQSVGSLGSLGDTLTVTGNVSKIVVGGDLRANVRVTGSLKTLQVKGSIVDGGIENGLVIDVSNTLNSLVVGGDIQPGVLINANMIKKQKVGGQNLGEFNIAQ
jgi:hypothetical protein